MVGTIRAIRRELSGRFAERDDVIVGMILALLAREHVVLLGPVGTGKSMLAAELCDRIEGARLFRWLMTRFSTPEELFGPISLQSLERDVYRRVTDGKLPEAHVVFLDEIFKANSAILNSLLSTMNERIYHDGAEARTVPLVTMIGASNELPAEDELAALYDRFLVRFAIDYIEDDAAFVRMLDGPSADGTRTTITLQELERCQQAVDSVRVSPAVLGDVAWLRRELEQRGVVASDRRYRASLALVRAAAWLDGRDVAQPSDLRVLADSLWQEPDEREAVVELIATVVDRYARRATELLDVARGVRDEARRPRSMPSASAGAHVEALTKLTALRRELHELYEEAAAAQRLSDRLESARADLDRMIEELLAEVG